jgi:hypothetical protein
MLAVRDLWASGWAMLVVMAKAHPTPPVSRRTRAAFRPATTTIQGQRLPRRDAAA